MMYFCLVLSDSIAHHKVTLVIQGSITHTSHLCSDSRHNKWDKDKDRLTFKTYTYD